MLYVNALLKIVGVVLVLDHPRSGVVYNFGQFCLSVKRLDVGSSYLHIRCYLQAVRVMFVYEGHRVSHMSRKSPICQLAYRNVNFRSGARKIVLGAKL